MCVRYNSMNIDMRSTLIDDYGCALLASTGSRWYPSSFASVHRTSVGAHQTDHRRSSADSIFRAQLDIHRTLPATVRTYTSCTLKFTSRGLARAAIVVGSVSLAQASSEARSYDHLLV